MTGTVGSAPSGADFRDAFRNILTTPADERYEAARRTWNWAIDCRPDLIASCRTTDDVVAAVNHARQTGINPAIRGGGHSFPGFSTCDGGMVIDLTPMRRVGVDADARVARVEGGATWSEFDAATQAHGLAATGGLISSTGVGGLTLGGGIGWLQRHWGLACDNLLGATVVTAAGRVVHASNDENADLFWGLRGGGGNFGIVTEFEFALHPLPGITGGLALFTMDRAREVLTFFREWTRDLPDEFTTLLAFIKAPPAPFVPAELQGAPVVAIVGCDSGDPDAAAASLQPLRQLGPAVDVFGPMPYVALQSMLDEGAPAGWLNYLKSGYLDALSDGVIDALVEAATLPASPFTAIHLHQMGGAVARVGEDDTAYSNRNAAFVYNLLAISPEPGAYEADRKWVRDLSAALTKFGRGGVYVNFISEADDASAAAAYGSKYQRLVDVKRRYDPQNLFRFNQNIKP